MSRSAGQSICVLPQDLDRLMPMNLVLDANAVLRQAGPTLHKIWPDALQPGKCFFDAFEVVRPAGISSISGIVSNALSCLYLRPKGSEAKPLKALAVPSDDGGLLLNLSFGIGIVDAVRSYNLSGTDFASTDLTIELLYLSEANEAAMAEWRRLSQRPQGARKEAEERAFTDTLTGLRNRRALDHSLEHLIERKTSFGLMQIDLDYFKAVNDTRGHAAGDFVLRRVADILRSHTRPVDDVIRVGGDEFVILFKSVTEGDALARIADRLIRAIEQPIMFEGQACRISASAGATLSCHYAVLNADQMMKDADAALCQSKENGRAQFSLSPDGVPRQDRANEDLGPDTLGGAKRRAI